MPLNTALPIESLCITHMQRFEYVLQAVFGSGNCHQVDVIAHKTIGQYVNFKLLAIIFKPVKVNQSVIVCIKDIFPPVSALCDVVGNFGENGSG